MVLFGYLGDLDYVYDIGLLSSIQLSSCINYMICTYYELDERLFAIQIRYENLTPFVINDIEMEIVNTFSYLDNTISAKDSLTWPS